MYLKRIELAGFKTFPDNMEVVLSPGVTAVVGPNGCGKSNLMDAVRWVLGEQRPRILRGGKMEEVIFSGTPQRAGLSAAEVTLIIDNHSGRLPTEFAEVAVSRRIDRSGESEYRLNGTPCRLKDFADLFLDTGMGSHGYAVIQAAMIDAILSENPDERRFLFEEAAGVSKYKLRQRAALRKMEATERDLVRLIDLKNEVATRVRSLARQKGMAERHRTLREAQRTIEVILASREYRLLRAQATDREREHMSAREKALAAAAQCDALDLEGQKLHLAVDEAERIAQAVNDRLAEVTGRWHTHETEQLRREDHKRHLQEERERLAERQNVIRARAIEAEGRVTEATRRHTDTGAAYDDIVRRAVAAEEQFRSIQQEAQRSANDVERRRLEWQVTQERHVRLTSQRDAASQHRAEAEQRRRVLEQRLDQSSSSISQAATELVQLESELSDVRVRLDAARAEVTTAEAALAEQETARTQSVEEMHRHGERVAHLQSGRDMLGAVIARGEGLGRGAAWILSDAERWCGRVVGWIDRLRPAAEWRHAVEAVLADKVGALWCEDPEVARSLVAHLSQGSFGRATVLDSALLSPQGTAHPPVTDPGFVGWLVDQIECDDPDRPWIEGIFGGVALADSLESARRLFTALSGRHSVVTRDGVLIAPPGSVSAGMESAEPIVGRAERLRDLDAELASAERALGAARVRITDLDARLSQERETCARHRSRVSELEKELSARLLAYERERTRLDENRRQTEELAGELKVITQESGDSATMDDDSLTKLKEEVDRLAAERQNAEDKAADAEQRAHAAAASLNAIRVETVEAQARRDAAATEIRRYRDMAAELTAEEESTRDRDRLMTEEIAALDRRIVEAVSEQQSLGAERERLDRERLDARTLVATEKERLSHLEQRLREFRHQREQLESQRAQMELELSGLRLGAEQCRRRILEAHQIDLEAAAIDDPPESDEELQRKSESLAQSIERLGPVNPLALEEYQREKERWSFFEHQVGDLRQAKASLTETIAELNRTAGERFAETFATARAHFQEVFTELFRGGEADVRLLEPERPLESPIEIFARPRGKKFVGIRQLSGGERALTALALLFGLYLVKPSPFCILDEVDAPLDDANCGRFLRLVDRFKVRTQFIIVTHNKLTMEAADVLYGITMEEPGISKIVSVRLDRAGEDGGEPGLAEPRFAIAANDPEATEVDSAVEATRPE
ncbi:MAG: chromosome segregation protein SMC [Candidatus Zixiibacteriota bacterium]